MKPLVYLADLRHADVGVMATDCMPLNVGYLKGCIDRDLGGEVESALFAFPHPLLTAMTERPPDVLMVSNYVWNESLAMFVCRQAQALNPNVLTVMGGPNISVDPDRQITFLETHPEIDVYVPGEGERTAVHVVRRWLAAGGVTTRLLGEDLPGCVQARPDGTVTRLSGVEGIVDVNAVPSPWLGGVMDRFFDDRMTPIIETNRGCPFQCAFCCQGSTARHIAHFDLERVRQEIEYIARMMKTRSPHVGTLRIADANFGMYERDLEIADAVARAQRDYGWPVFIDATCGKNRPERVIKAVEKLGGALTPCLAVQSMNPEVLKEVRRRNISLDSYTKIQEYLHGKGLKSMSDLILGLPGESRRTHMEALGALIDAGTDQAHCFQAMMLKGADMESRAMREKHEFVTRWRALAKSFGRYCGQPVIETEEIIVGTASLSQDDYMECRRFHLAFSVFWNDGWFDEVVRFAGRFGVAKSQWLAGMLRAMEEDDGAVRRLLEGFVAETAGELFPSAAACVGFYGADDNFERFRRGELGDNLLYKYRAMASFFTWKKLCACAMDATARMLIERGAGDAVADFEGFWRDFHAYMQARHASGESRDQILAPVAVSLQYDIARWMKDGMQLQLTNYRSPQPQAYRFELTVEGRREMGDALNVWSCRLPGLSKLVTRIRVQSQVRRCVPAAPDAAQALMGARKAPSARSAC